ncbi:CD82 molecule a [Clarias gariepinus]|uniref:CD82 molecule a n=1 Tax=Clarias gariepinus TaxID=13013 RepID=UPI00234CB39A|nr:CD82 molecule a [Clarias gariepinus]XP_053369783.1 CD82 molecule a [Clarias gariepinus]XP_053369784.1 CD82 molecule a [Clarias gariepinus]
MGKGCITATKYFLSFFNFLFFIFGALIMGFGLWILLDNQSFLAIMQDSSVELKLGSYIVIGVGAFTMLMGFLGCLGAIYEIRCLLGLYFTLLLLLLIAQVAVTILIFFQREQLRKTTSNIVIKVVENYQGQNKTAEKAWDYIQRSMHCCGWESPDDWDNNTVVRNSSMHSYPCSCYNSSAAGDENGFCNSGLALYSTGCMSAVENWLFTNYGVILGICLGVAVIELLAMILSMGLCKSVQQEEYTKVPKY